MTTAADPSTSRRVGLGTVGLLIGGALAFVEFGYVVLTAPLLLFPVTRARVHTGARTLAEVERWRIARYLDSEASRDYAGFRALQYVAVRSVVGGLGAGIFLLMLFGMIGGVIMLGQVLNGLPVGGGDPLGTDSDWYDPFAVLLFGTLLTFLAVQGLLGVASLDRRLAQHFLGPTSQELLRRRLSFVTRSRAEVVDAVNDERRRIERALHDGVQQRLVALGMVLGRARRSSDPDRTDELLRQAHEEAQQALLDLREVAWRVYPVALDSGGLHGALEALAERSGVPVDLTFTLPERLDTATETVAYFVVSEGVTNAIKHARASRIQIDVSRTGDLLVVRVRDDGAGGARPEGDGLSGLARRVSAADGTFTVDSPVGGPTTVRAELPCA
ncbi:Histidine kinase-, DNA gyrase B-, and HSP90-like ATPase [Amycolatopsis marina]|uniref:histidine kinase n=1 Tax=Amycolatopsis marina TaxID=490629 RepID=A0A1I0X9B1_9PSEU|nr:sensor histidine kinase [Amycolatopsis marina]SFA97521.1 Histidine kinase-, DNA gyrase B-, and HSP90-like ATPase [Amycolatopsis marina]